MEDLHGDAAMRVAVLGSVDLAHPTTAEQTDHAIDAKLISRSESIARRPRRDDGARGGSVSVGGILRHRVVLREIADEIEIVEQEQDSPQKLLKSA
jgi:hypothetical protein